jgi:hypothetical protein
MNGKKAKLIRKLAKQEGKFKLEPNYQVKETKKMMYGTGKDGKPMAYQVSRNTVINLNRIEYRKLKKAYSNGEFEI